MLRKVVVVFKTHFDLGFTGLPDEVMRTYTGPMFEAVRKTMEATANESPNLRYCWTLPAWPLRFLLHDPSVPQETRQEARRLVQEGRLHWHAWPFTTHTAFCGLEDLVRGLHISRALSEEFGRWPTGAKQTDVPGHTWILPSLLAQAGVKFLHLGCNSGSHAPHVPPFFWWEGPDGSRLLTFYSPGGYGTSLLPPDDWPYDTWLSLQQTVDNHGPHTPEELLRIRRTIEEGAPGAEILFGQLGDFSDSLLEHPEQLADLPIVSYDLADTWIHGIGTMPREVARARELRAKLLALECASVAYDWPGVTATSTGTDFPLARKIAPLIDAAYEQLLLFGEHTWGLDVKSTIKRVYGDEFAQARRTEPYKRLEQSWVAKAAYIERAEEMCMQASRRVQEARQAEPREEVIDELLSDAEKEWAEILAQRKSREDNAPDNVLEDNWFRLEVDPSIGGIVSLLDKQSGHEWVDSSSGEPFGGYRYDLYSITDIAEFMRTYGTFFQDWFVQDFGKQGYPEGLRHTTAYARNFALEKVRDKGGSVIRLKGGYLRVEGRSDIDVPRQEVSLDIRMGSYRNLPYIELDYQVEGKEATPLAESTVIPFPLNLRRPTFRLGQTGSVIDPARDIVEGANRNLWCADWIYATDDRVGLSLYAVDMPLISVGSTGIYRFNPGRVPNEPVIYAHLSNTQWGTNFPQWLEGGFRWRVRLFPDIHGWQWGGMHYMSKAMETEPLVERRWDALFRIQYAELLSVRPRHDGPGLLVRVSEQRGRHQTAWLQPHAPVSAIWRCDLMERPIERLALTRESQEMGGGLDVALPLKPYAIETLLIEFDSNKQ
jgi:alpha-mannosidase